MGGKEGPGGRRLSDEWNRWASAVAASLASLMMAMIIFFYASVPKDIAELRESISVIKVEISTIKDQQQELVETGRTAQKIAERVTVVEQRADRNTERITGLEKRVERLEDKPRK